MSTRNLTIPKVYLAPMAGYTDAAMRSLCVQYGAQMTVTEMVSAKGLLYRNKRSEELMQLGDGEQRVVVQLFGKEPQDLAQAAQTVEKKLGEKLFGIDINMGCPAPKIVRSGEGCALMDDKNRAARIVEAVKAAVNVPVSVKFRLGFTVNNALDFAKQMERAGADILTVHGRMRCQYYSGEADLDVIGEIKNAVRAKVIGNGDIRNAADVERMFKKTGCDAVMIGRSARGNPFLFAQIKERLTLGEVLTVPTQEERIRICLAHARQMLNYANENIALRRFRAHLVHYLKGLKGASKLREQAVRAETYDQLKQLLGNAK